MIATHPFANLTLDELRIKVVGTTVYKSSGKPFKSGKWNATVKDVLIHPITQRLAFLFEEDESYVEAGRCLPGKDNEIME